jgi:5-methylcytosine-specific restriction enzyme A
MNTETIIKLIREDNLMKFYKSKEWRSLRKVALQRDHYECQSCKRKGKYRKGQNVHHMKELKEHPALALTLDNLETLCIPCHNEEHERLDKVNNKRPKFINEERW